jgi:hypothetical protein
LKEYPCIREECTPASVEGVSLYQVRSNPVSGEEHPCIRRRSAPVTLVKVLEPVASGAPLYQEKEHPCNPGEGVEACGEWCTPVSGEGAPL